MVTRPRRGSFLLGGLFVLVVVLVVAGGVGFAWLRSSLPQDTGKIAVAGLSKHAQVLRDVDGLVTIRAENEVDAARALGFVHAQDRLWQMDFMRRSGAGRLSEVLGSRTLAVDRFMRTLGLYRLAEANVEDLSEPLHAVLSAYAEGVNAFLDSPDRTLPLEFHLLAYTPERWRIADSLVWGRLMALQLSGNWHEELLRARIEARLGIEKAQALWPTYPEGAPTTLAETLDAASARRFGRLAAILPWSLAPKDASNAWALGGGATASGRPLLASDPHLALDSPATWYLARIETPESASAGATAPGVPLIVLGHNGAAAWGFTTTHSDTQDLFIERIDESDPTRYQTPDGPVPFEVREETIPVRGQIAQTLKVRTTRHGPVISDALDEKPGTAAGAGTVLALAWPGLRTDDRTFNALYRITRARTWDAFRAALDDFHSPQQNIVYADRAGTVAFMAPGRVPIRKRGDGQRPVPGWTGEYDWTGEIAYTDLPGAVDPPDGQVVTANNKIVPEDYPHFLTADWPPPYRAARIRGMLSDNGGEKHDLESMIAIQQDTVSLAAAELLPFLLAVPPANDGAKAALAALADWNGRMGRNAGAPLIYAAWLQALNRLILADDLGPEFPDFRRPRVPLLARILQNDEPWCDNIASEPVETCKQQVSAALAEALVTLARVQDQPIGKLRWGAAHVARFPHPIFDKVTGISNLIGIAAETPGGSHTINRAGIAFSDGAEMPFENVHGPAYRAVYDLSDLDASRFILAPGQSGNPLSPHYANLVERWRDGAYVTLDGEAKRDDRLLLLVPQ